VKGPSRAPYGIALRIWVVTAAAVLATGAALILVLRLWREPPPDHPFLDLARYASERIAARWPSEEGVRDELLALARDGRLRAAAHRWDGGVLAAGPGASAPTLSAAERAALVAQGVVERRGDCFRGVCAVAYPVVRDGAPAGYVLVESPGPPEGRRPPPPELLPIALLLAGLGVAAALLGGSIARPLDRLARTARALGSGDLAARTGVARRDEVGALAHALDEMADRVVGLLRGQTELIANVAHELRTPLARIRVALDLAADGDAAVARESLAEIREDLSELERLVDDVLASARIDLAGEAGVPGAPSLRRAELDLAAVAHGAAERLRHRHPERSVELALAPGLPPVDGDAVLLRRALDNLLDNARKYSPPGAPIRLEARPCAGGIELQVIDRGEGIAPQDLARLFTPFFRADRSRARATGGVGLGLALSRRIAEAHGGTLTAASAAGEGTTFTLRLPAGTPPPRP